MAFLFSSSHLPASRVRRPDLDDEDNDENREAMPRSGGVRASSHLPERREPEAPYRALSQRGAQASARQFQYTEEATPHQDGVTAAKASGVFDAVRQQYNNGDSPHYMDEDGNLRPRDEARRQDAPAPHDPRSPQFGAGAPGRSPGTSSAASDDTRPWYMPPITPEDLDSQHHDDDDSAGSHSALNGRPEVHDLAYRTQGTSPPKPGFQDLLYRYNGNPEEAGDHRSDYFHNVVAAADARGHLTQQSKSYGAAPDSRGNAGNSSFGNPLASTAPSPPPLTTQDVLDLADKSELGAAKRQFKARLAEQQRLSKELADAKQVLQANQDNIRSLQNLRETLKWTKKGYDYGRKRLPKHLRDKVDKIMEETGADPAAQIQSLDAMIKESEARTAGNEKAIQQAEEAYRQALKATQDAAQRMRDLEEQKKRSPVSPPAPAPVPTPSPPPPQQHKLPTQPWT